MSAYKTMWLMVMFDMPTDSKKAQRMYRWFREKLLKDGYIMMQYSIYLKPFHSQESARAGKERLKNFISTNTLHGSIRLMMFTDKQYSNMEVLVGVKTENEKRAPKQLTLF